MQFSRLFNDFFASEKAGGFILICSTIFSLLIVNSAIGAQYAQIWHFEIAHHSLTHWINDLLMTIFFLLVGLEIEREIYIGELRAPGKAIFPVIAAFGGMLVPASVFIMFNVNGGDFRGFGIPMATDIAFALGVLSLLGSRIPPALKVFLTALAIIDDLGAILIIAFFYSEDIQSLYLIYAGFVFLLLVGFNRMGVRKVWPYLLFGVIMWYCMLQSGIHATLAGVLLAFAIPFKDGGETSPSYKMQHFLHKPVAFFILPVFALANTAIILDKSIFDGFISPQILGIMAGLVIGKPVGILLFTRLAVWLKIARLPEQVKWKHVTGAGILAGIGFTMSIFICLLAFSDEHAIAQSKLAILLASCAAALLGVAWLYLAGKRPADRNAEK